MHGPLNVKFANKDVREVTNTSNLQKYIYVIIQLCSILIYAKSPDYCFFLISHDQQQAYMAKFSFWNSYYLYYYLPSATLCMAHLSQKMLSVLLNKRENWIAQPLVFFSW